MIKLKFRKPDFFHMLFNYRINNSLIIIVIIKKISVFLVCNYKTRTSKIMKIETTASDKFEIWKFIRMGKKGKNSCTLNTQVSSKVIILLLPSRLKLHRSYY